LFRVHVFVQVINTCGARGLQISVSKLAAAKLAGDYSSFEDVPEVSTLDSSTSSWVRLLKPLTT